jgi:hypothetical protein
MNFYRSEIRDGRPWTDGDTKLFAEIPKDKQAIVSDWIAAYILPRKTPLLHRSSYGIKHILQGDTGIYLTNNQFKQAMLLCGYSPVNEHEAYWHFRISERSPAFMSRAKKQELQRLCGT